MYAQLGNIIFEQLIAFDSLNKKNEASIAEHKLMDGKPRLQKTGQNLIKYDFTIQFHSLFCNPEVEISALHTACENGDVLPFVNGLGVYFGDFVIESVDEELKQTDSKGGIILANCSVSLIEFVTPNKITQKNQAAKEKGFANAANNPVKRKTTIRFQGEASSIMKSQNDVRKTTASAGNAITQAKQDASRAQQLLRKAQRLLKKAQKGLQDVNQKLTDAKHAYQATLRIKQAIVMSATYVANAIEAASTGDIDGAINANRELQKSVARQNGACTEVAGLTGLKKV